MYLYDRLKYSTWVYHSYLDLILERKVLNNFSIIFYTILRHSWCHLDRARGFLSFILNNEFKMEYVFYCADEKIAFIKFYPWIRYLLQNGVLVCWIWLLHCIRYFKNGLIIIKAYLISELYGSLYNQQFSKHSHFINLPKYIKFKHF